MRMERRKRQRHRTLELSTTKYQRWMKSPRDAMRAFGNTVMQCELSNRSEIPLNWLEGAANT